MTEKTLANSMSEFVPLTPQDGRPAIGWTGVLSIILSLAVILAALFQIGKVNPAQILPLIPTNPVFWALFIIGYLAGPFSEWIIFRRLWNVGLAAFGALTRKLAYNELLLGYLGEAWFYAWARKKGVVEGSPFGAVKDVAILSAMAGNAVTLVLVFLAFPFAYLLPLGEYSEAIVWSLLFVIGTSLVAMIWSDKVFSLSGGELRMIFAIHVARIVASAAISALLWYMVLPDTPLEWWLLLVAIRLLISRLPFIPNKDVAFAGLAVFVTAADAQVALLITMMSGLILIANMMVGLGFSALDLMKGVSPDGDSC